MEIKIYPLGAYGTNCYFVINNRNKELLVIDPGDDSDFIINEINKNQYKLKAILLTHGHFDHVGAVDKLASYYNINVYVNSNELKNMERDNTVYFKKVNSEVNLINDKDVLNLAGFNVSCIHTPGHSSGGMCFLINKNLFAGDTLFQGSIGRTDMITGDFKLLIKSILEKLMILDKDIKVYPGHGPSSTIEFEKIRNPFLQ